MSSKWAVAMGLSTVVALPPNSCSFGSEGECESSVQGSAMLQLQGVQSHSHVPVHEVDEVAHMEYLNDLGMIEMELDASTFDVDSATLKSWRQQDKHDRLLNHAIQGNTGDDAEVNHIIELVSEAADYVRNVLGANASKAVEAALADLKTGGLPAIQSNEAHQNAIGEAFAILSEEEEIDDAVDSGKVVGMEDIMAITGQTSNPMEASGCAEGDMCSFKQTRPNVTASDNSESKLLIEQRIAAGYRFSSKLFNKDKRIPVGIWQTDIFGNPTPDRLMRRYWFKALQHIMNKVPCLALQFEDYGDEFPAYGIELGNMFHECSAGIGANGGGAQGVNMATNCQGVGIMVHEICHALGMYHENSRPDRDNNIIVHWENIQNAYKSQFVVKPSGDTKNPYDLSSVMHYTEKAFSSNGLPTLEVKPGVKVRAMGNAMGLTKNDVSQLADMYGCSASIGNLCPIHTTTTEQCQCRESKKSSLPIIKVVQQDEATGLPAYKCVQQCPDCGAKSCNCPIGCTKHKAKNGRAYCVETDMFNQGKMTSCETGEPMDFNSACEYDYQADIKEYRAKSLLRKRRSCKDIISSTYCADHSLLCNHTGVSVRHKIENMDFASEACAKTCKYCE